jgi:hypothetical protein
VETSLPLDCPAHFIHEDGLKRFRRWRFAIPRTAEN